MNLDLKQPNLDDPGVIDKIYERLSLMLRNMRKFVVLLLYYGDLATYSPYYADLVQSVYSRACC